MVEVVAKVTRTLPNDIHVAVRKATNHLSNQPKGGLDAGDRDVESLLAEANAERSTKNASPTSAKTLKKTGKKDPNETLKTSLLEVLNGKATQEELNQLRSEKTNKTDMDMQMKCLDILHK